MIDIHSHLLYGIDDGSRSIVESAYIIKSLSEIGYTDIILTPHFINGSSYMSTRENNLDLLDRLKVELIKHQIPVNLYLGNEIYIDSDIIKLFKEGIISSLNDSKYLLIELPMSGENEIYYDVFLDLINMGYKVVLAHPVAYVHEDNLTDEDILEIVNDMKPDGLEANYLYVDRYDKKFNETEKWNEFAKKHNLFVTVGSDFHNKDGLRPEIGFINTDFVLAEEVIEEIIRNITFKEILRRY